MNPKELLLVNVQSWTPGLRSQLPLLDVGLPFPARPQDLLSKGFCCNQKVVPVRSEEVLD